MSMDEIVQGQSSRSGQKHDFLVKARAKLLARAAQPIERWENRKAGANPGFAITTKQKPFSSPAP
jgi:hypothetical protein